MVAKIVRLTIDSMVVIVDILMDGLVREWELRVIAQEVVWSTDIGYE